MANLDQYEQQASEGDLGDAAAEKLKNGAQGLAKKGAKKGAKKAGKLAKKGAAKAADALGLNAVKAAAAKGAKAAATAALHAAKAALMSAISFLVSNPVGWIILAVLVIGGIAICANLDKLPDGADGEVTEALLTDEGLSEDGVAVLMGDCPEVKTGGALSDNVNVDVVVENNAKMIYAVFLKYGLTKEQIAGMLGNLFAESGIDTTSVEGIYNEPYQIGPKKQAALADIDAHVTGHIWPSYENKGLTIRKGGYLGPDGKNYCGLGFPQWTGPAAYALLNFAQSTGRDWWACDFQTAYMLSDAHYRPGFFKTWKENPQTDVIAAERYFAEHYEGTTGLATAERQEAAQMWYEKMDSWEVDEAYANSIFKLSQAMGADAADKAAGNASSSGPCPDAKELGAFDNSSIALSAVSYAYPTKAEGKGNNGTALYVQVHDNVFPGDTIYQSCDRSIACAIRWSGSDDTFPSGDSTGQHNYLKASPKWESLGMASGLTMDKLEPGDVFATPGHVLLYVGHEAVVQIHGDKAPADADSVSGSFGERSPGCGNDATRIIQRGGVDGKGRAYEVFRCVDPDESETYKNAGSSAVIE